MSYCNVQVAITFEKGSSTDRLTNSAITDFNREQVDELGKHHWIQVWGSYHTIDWNDFIDKETIGELMQIRAEYDYPPDADPESWGHHIAHNFFGPRPETATADDGEALQIGLSSSDFLNYNCTVEFNLFEDYDGEIECISVKSSGNIIQYNTFRNSACTVTLRHTNRTVVQENYFFCDGKFHCGGIRMHGYEHVIRNNYIEEELYDQGSIAGVSLYQGVSNDTKRDINKNSTIEDNVM